MKMKGASPNFGSLTDETLRVHFANAHRVVTNDLDDLTDGI